MSGSPRPRRLSNVPGGLPGPEDIDLSPQVGVAAVEGSREVRWGRCVGEARGAGHTLQVVSWLLTHGTQTTHVSCFQGFSVETQRPGYLLGSGHMGTLCPACTNSQKGSLSQHKCQCSHSSIGTVTTLIRQGALSMPTFCCQPRSHYTAGLRTAAVGQRG